MKKNVKSIAELASEQDALNNNLTASTEEAAAPKKSRSKKAKDVAPVVEEPKDEVVEPTAIEVEMDKQENEQSIEMIEAAQSSEEVAPQTEEVVEAEPEVAPQPEPTPEVKAEKPAKEPKAPKEPKVSTRVRVTSGAIGEISAFVKGMLTPAQLTEEEKAEGKVQDTIAACSYGEANRAVKEKFGRQLYTSEFQRIFDQLKHKGILTEKRPARFKMEATPAPQLELEIKGESVPEESK